jgi:hypothetical protein
MSGTVRGKRRAISQIFHPMKVNYKKSSKLMKKATIVSVFAGSVLASFLKQYDKA